MILWRYGLAAALLLLAQAAPAAWTEARSRHFLIYSEQRPAELKAFAENLERFDQAVRRARSLPDPQLTDSGRVRVYIVANSRKLNGLYGLPGEGLAGFYRTDAGGARAFAHRDRGDAWGGDPQSVLFHEYLHHLMLQSLDYALPAWMVEGTAEFFGTAEVLGDGSVRFGKPPAERSYGLFMKGGLSTREMVGATDQEWDGRDWESVYARGWLLTHYLTLEPKRQGQLARYVRAIGEGRSALDAAGAAFGDLDQLHRDTEKYLRQRTLPAATIPAASLTPGEVRLRPLSAVENELMGVRLRLDSRVTKLTAPDLARDARALAARNPRSAIAHATHAEAEAKAKRYAEALAAAERAIALDPGLGKALLLKGQALMELGRKQPAATDWKAVRSWFTRANRLDADNAEPLLLFYQSYAAEGRAATANSIEGLLYARALVPQDDELRMVATRQLVGDGRFPEAIRTFGALAYDPHAGQSRTRRMKIMAALKAGDGKQAGQLLKEEADELEAKED